jgi:hypothetical protein
MNPHWFSYLELDPDLDPHRDKKQDPDPGILTETNAYPQHCFK